MKNDAIIFGLTSSQDLAKKISERTGIELGESSIKRFADGEVMFRAETSVRGKNVYLVGSTCKPVNESVMEMLIAIDALKRASVRTISCIVPYYGYARQDRKALGREPITSRMVADLIQAVGANRVLTLDIHSDQQQGFFSIPFDSLTATWIMLNELWKNAKLPMEEVTIVSPDYGGVKRARAIASKLGVPMAIVDKRRPRPNEVEIENILGDVEGRHCILPDDMIDTGGTMINVAKLLKKKGAKSISIMATHGLFNGTAIEKFNDAFKEGWISNLYVTNSIENNDKPKNCTVVDVSPLIAEAILVFNAGSGSISHIYEKFMSFNKK